MPTKKGQQRTQDSVSTLMENWARSKPELGPKVPSVVARILRLSSIFRKQAELLNETIGFSWDIAEIVIALRRSGEPFEMTPTELYRSMVLTSGAITSRLDRTEAAGFIKRVAAQNDRRSTIVRLTASGKAMSDKAITAYYAEMESLLEGLTSADMKQLAGLLSKLLLNIETTLEE